MLLFHYSGGGKYRLNFFIIYLVHEPALGAGRPDRPVEEKRGRARS